MLVNSVKNIVFCLILLFFLFEKIVWANFGSSVSGEAGIGALDFEALKQIEMEREWLKIELYKNNASVTVLYRFKNKGEDVTVTAGFPTISWKEGEVDTSNYSIFVQGEKINFDLKKGKKVDWFGHAGYLDLDSKGNPMPMLPKINWFISTISFKKREIKEIKIKYLVRYEVYSSGVGNEEDIESGIFRYLLSTASIWKGKIKKGFVVINAVGVDPNKIVFKNESRFIRKGNTFTWNFTNLEPSKEDDIEINMKNGFMKDLGTKIICGDYGCYKPVQYEVLASSTYKSKNNYEISNVKDEKVYTAWVEGVEGSGIGESLTIVPLGEVKRIAIFPGYGKSHHLYFANNRVAEFEITLNGKHRFKAKLENKLKPWHFIELPSIEKIKKIRLVINKVYKGSKYDDTAISSIELQNTVEEVDY